HTTPTRQSPLVFGDPRRTPLTPLALRRFLMSPPGTSLPRDSHLGWTGCWGADHPASPVHVPLHDLPLTLRHFGDVGNQEAVVLQVRQHFAACAEVLRLALSPAHGEPGRSLIGPHIEQQVSTIELDVIDSGDPAQEVATREGGAKQPLVAGRPSTKVPDDAELAFMAIAVPKAEADEVVGPSGRETAYRKRAAVDPAVGQLDFKRVIGTFSKHGRVGFEPSRSEIGL